jgi:hypothetical protein
MPEEAADFLPVIAVPTATAAAPLFRPELRREQAPAWLDFVEAMRRVEDEVYNVV